MRDKSVIKFLAVGVCNTVLSAVLMLVLHEKLGLGYWGATAPSYLAGAALSYWLNRQFTFKSDTKVTRSLPRFALNVAVCYLIANVIAKSVVTALLEGFVFQEQFAMLAGMGLYTCLNYIGQRWFAFRAEKKEE